MDFRKDLPMIAFTLLTAFSMKVGAAPTRVMAPTAVSTASSHQFKSYREWKMDQVQEAQGKVSSIKTILDQKKQTRQLAQGTDPNLAMRKGGSEADANLEKQLQQELFDLEVAKDLSVTDYFVGYLTKVNDKKSAINEVAGKLSPEEVAELMTAYANSVFGSHVSDLPTSASNVSKDQVK